MKRILPFLLIFVSGISYAQNMSYHSFQFFEDYLVARTYNGNKYSIDSIIKTSNIYDYIDKNIFIAIKKDSNKNITDAKISWDESNYDNDLWDILKVEYTGDNLFKTYTYLHNFYNRFDTMLAIKWDKKRNIIMSLKSDEKECYTNNPPSAQKTNYLYNDKNQKIKTNILVKWTYNCQNRPLDKWVDSYNIDYLYENDLLKEENHTSANIYTSGIKKDTFTLDLKPYRKAFYSYYDDNKLHTYTYKYWDNNDNGWKIHLEDTYSYPGDTIVKQRRFWIDSIQNWKNIYNIKTRLKNDHEEKTEQRWNDSLLIWENRFHEYYISSQVSGYYDKITEIWNKDENNWKYFASDKYFYQGDTLVRLQEHPQYSDKKELFVFDQNGNLTNHTLFHKLDNEEWKWNQKTINKYNEYNNITDSYTRYNYKNRFVKIKYYWDNQSKTPKNLLVDPDNQWNVGFWYITSPDSDSKRYKFSTHRISIGGFDYYQLLFSNDEIGNNWSNTTEFYREENGKIWKYNNHQGELLYDFTLEKGDTFSSDLLNGFKLIVEKTDSFELLNGEKRKALLLYCSNEPDTVNHSYYGLRTWVGGIGDLNGLLSVCNSCLYDNNTDLLCYYYDNEMLYSSDSHSYCWTAATLESFVNKTVIFPNPANSTININPVYNIKNITIYDNYGRKIKIFSTRNIDISRLKQGQYYIKIQYLNGKIENFRFIKN
jgi:hypothetical protein